MPNVGLLLAVLSSVSVGALMKLKRPEAIKIALLAYFIAFKNS